MIRTLCFATALLLLCACEVVDRPNRPVPEDFEVTMLDGTVIGKKELLGQRWVINFWLPG